MKKKCGSYTYYSLGELRIQCAEFKKADKKEQAPHDSLCRKCPEHTNLTRK